MADAGLILDFVVNGLVLGGIIALAAIGLTLVYGILDLSNFAHGDMLTLGAYAAFLWNVSAPHTAPAAGIVVGIALLATALWRRRHWETTVAMGTGALGSALVGLGALGLSSGPSLLLSILLAVAVVPAFAVGLDSAVWRHLRRRRATTVTFIITSIGVALALRNALAMAFGSDLHNYARAPRPPMQIGGVIITNTQVVTVATAATLIVGVHVLLKYTRLGKMLRAMRDDRELAAASGIDTEAMVRVVWMIAGALAAVAGVLLALNVNVNPNLGWNLILPIFAAVILGGIGSPYGALLGALVIAVAMEISVAWAPEYRLATGFAILIVTLILRPQGILGGTGMNDARRATLIIAATLVIVAVLSHNSSRGLIDGIGWRYLEGVAMTMLIFAIMAMGLNLQFGHTGLLNFGHAAFMLIGTYTAALAARHFDIYAAGPIAILWALLIIATAAAASAGAAFLMGLPTLRLREDYLAIVTIGAAEILRTVTLNESRITNGPLGLSVRMPGSDWLVKDSAWTRAIDAAPVALDSYYTFLIMVAVALLAGYYVVIRRLVAAPWGRVLKAIREDEDAAASLGKDVFRFKVQSLIIGSIMASTAGVLWAWYQRFIAPDNFLPIVTFYAWIALVVGGVGNNKGAIVGSVLLWGLFESARNLPGQQFTTGPFQVFVIGVLLVVIMMVRPQGIMGRREDMLYAR